jgi:RHS repeat-associated protein
VGRNAEVKVSRIVLPTGGAYEYDWTGTEYFLQDEDPSADPYRLVSSIYRRETIHYDAVGTETAPLTLVQTYPGYDGLNRLTAFRENGRNQTYNYDAFGNRWVNPSDPGLPANAQMPTMQSDYDAATNRRLMTVDCSAHTITDPYDGRGNLKYACPFTLTYDAENRVVNADGGTSGSGAYSYDGSGRRVVKTANGVTTKYVYDAFGNLADEYADAGGAAGTEYYTGDALGSTRLVTDESGAVLHRYDYLPFGEGLDGTVNGRSQKYSAYNAGAFPAGPGDGDTVKFTGKERDSESGLDYFGARYYASSMGRFTSPDPMLNSGRPDNPQTWNRYSYALNNPLTVTDPTGMYNLVNNCAADNKQCNSDFNNSAKNLKNGLADLTSAVTE